MTFNEPWGLSPRASFDGLARIDEVTAEHVRRWGERFVNGGRRSKTTRRHHETSIKSFTAWLERTGRIPTDPLKNLRRTHVLKNEEVRTRNAFTQDELVKILRSARNGPVRRRMTGPQRELLYRFCIETGFRAAEAAAIRKQDFADDFNSVHLAPWFAKNGKSVDQPLPEWLRDDIAAFIQPLNSDDFLWPGGWTKNESKEWVTRGWVLDRGAGRVLKFDADNAGLNIAQKAKEQNQGRVLDFHSLRHNYGISLRGLPKETQMRLLRVSTESVWGRYCHPDDVKDLRERIEAINSRKPVTRAPDEPCTA